jgi:N-methylhydantoinase A
MVYGRIEAVSHAFDVAHKQAYGYASPDAAREIVNLRVAVMVPLPKFKLSSLSMGTPDPKYAQTGSRKVFLRNKWIEANIYQKSKLRANNMIEGPSLIEQSDSTTLVDIGWKAEVKNDGHLLLRRLLLR